MDAEISVCLVISGDAEDVSQSARPCAVPQLSPIWHAGRIGPTRRIAFRGGGISKNAVGVGDPREVKQQRAKMQNLVGGLISLMNASQKTHPPAPLAWAHHQFIIGLGATSNFSTE